MPQLLTEIEERVERKEKLKLVGGGNGFPPVEFGDGGEAWYPRQTPKSTYTIGMVIGFAASTMFFLALLSAAVVHKGMPDSNWMAFQIPWILWCNSAIAIVSSVTMTLARRLYSSGDQIGYSRWWKLTALLGTLFLIGQVLAWRQLTATGVYMRSNPSVSFYYVFTVAHGLHLLGGVIALLWIAFRHKLIMARSTATALAAMYWHFVTVLWLCLFLYFLIGG
jgi:cytochrome c oxidase subunit III